MKVVEVSLSVTGLIPSAGCAYASPSLQVLAWDLSSIIDIGHRYQVKQFNFSDQNSSKNIEKNIGTAIRTSLWWCVMRIQLIGINAIVVEGEYVGCSDHARDEGLACVINMALAQS